MPVLSQAELSAISVLNWSVVWYVCLWGVGNRCTLKLGMAFIFISTLLLLTLKLQREVPCSYFVRMYAQKYNIEEPQFVT